MNKKHCNAVFRIFVAQITSTRRVRCTSRYPLNLTATRVYVECRQRWLWYLSNFSFVSMQDTLELVRAQYFISEAWDKLRPQALFPLPLFFKVYFTFGVVIFCYSTYCHG